jgi:hypothetical protein
MAQVRALPTGIHVASERDRGGQLARQLMAVIRDGSRTAAAAGPAR